MSWTTLDTALALALMVAIVHGSCACDERPRKCRWESKYANTLQHDIHREWVCK
jgi:hypothetical protein